MRFARLALVALATLAALPALAEDLAYEVVNDSSATLTEFYTSPASDPNWSENMVTAGHELAPGESGTVTIADGSAECTYDLRAVFDDGSELVDAVNVCELATYTVTD
ncbi:hypothetical protein [Rubellimicrobium roseum]|uniref:Argininosuccinate lyase n=1 Tax=Rubellimicrobium roseum TaxID=687525 RepID=A0A5C4NEP8_9RHOB|nr:hypothetical protein [Rubellimicrobium roseum]TNC72410.1 hypothetical protein FHG71_08455 [Rubellimicrobium roseum]